MNQKDTVYVIAFVCVAIWLVFEHHSRREQDRQIAVLQQQLNQMADLATEANERMSNVVTQVYQLQSQRMEQTKELVQLRDEARVLRRQTNEIEALRDEVYRVRAAVEDGANPQNTGRRAANSGITPKSTRLQIMEAYYWTPNKVIDVTRQLNDRIVGDRLEIIAGNDLRGDPDFGQAKTLTVVSRFDGFMMTNEVREGGLLVIPEE